MHTSALRLLGPIQWGPAYKSPESSKDPTASPQSCSWFNRRILGSQVVSSVRSVVWMALGPWKRATETHFILIDQTITNAMTQDCQV